MRRRFAVSAARDLRPRDALLQLRVHSSDVRGRVRPLLHPTERGGQLQRRGLRFHLQRGVPPVWLSVRARQGSQQLRELLHPVPCPGERDCDL